MERHRVRADMKNPEQSQVAQLVPVWNGICGGQFIWLKSPLPESSLTDQEREREIECDKKRKKEKKADTERQRPWERKRESLQWKSWERKREWDIKRRESETTRREG